MIAFPSMLVGPAEKAGIKTPDLSSTDDWDTDEFPHFTVFCRAQLGRPMKMDGEQWRNARVIAAIPEERIRLVSLDDLINLGFEP